MLRCSSIVLATILWLGGASSAQQGAQPTQTAAAGDVKEGRRLFAQKCAMCHVPATRGADPYGPKLSKAQVNVSEEGVTQIISNGGLRMPGFRYTLEPRQIAAIMAFLKTLEVQPDRIVTETPSP